MTKKRSVILGATGIVYNWRMQIWYIYGLADPETPVVRYVGKTNDPCARLRNHLSDARKGGRNHRARWLAKILREGGMPRVIICEVGFGVGAAEAERKWIAHYRRLGNPLVNSSDGGDGSPGYVHSPEVREKIRKNLLDRPAPSADTRAKISRANKGKRRSLTTRVKMSVAQRGLKKALTDNGRRRLQESAQRSRTIAGEERMAAVARETISAFNNSQSHEQRSARATEVNLETWAKRTSEDRERISKNISAGHLKLTPEKRQEISAKGNAAIAASPEIRQAIGNRISGWWTSLTPEAKAEYLERRTAAIKEGKARKKREREAAEK